MIISDCIQGEEIWLALRHGRLTMSEALGVIDPKGNLKTRRDKARPRALIDDVKNLNWPPGFSDAERQRLHQEIEALPEKTRKKYVETHADPNAELSPSVRETFCDLLAETFCQCLTDPGRPCDCDTNWDNKPWTGNVFTDRGTELEETARRAFTAHTGLSVVEVGFVTPDDNPAVGCSPDGLLTDYPASSIYVGGLELKCPIKSTFLKYLALGTLPAEHKVQVHGGMSVTGLDRWHWFCYYPGWAPIHHVIERDEFTNNLAAALDRFTKEYLIFRAELLPKLQPKPEPTTK